MRGKRMPERKDYKGSCHRGAVKLEAKMALGKATACKVCGVHAFANGRGPNGQEMSSINVRALEGVDPASVPVSHFDARKL